MRKAPRMMRTALAAGVAIGMGLGGAAMAQNVRMTPMPEPGRLLLVDHHAGNPHHGKMKHREPAYDGEDVEGGGRSFAGGWGLYYVPPPNYYSPPPGSAYSMPNAPAAPPVAATPSGRAAAQSMAPAATSGGSTR